MAKNPLFFSDRPAHTDPVPLNLVSADLHPSDPLSGVVALLHPAAVSANLISGKGDWAVRYAEFGLPSFCIALQGRCMLEVEGHLPLYLYKDDFVLLPATPAFTLSGGGSAPLVHFDPHKVAGRTTELRYGDPGGAPDMLALGGAFRFGGPNPALLVSLLPPVVHIRGSERLTQLVAMVGQEAGTERPGRDFMLSRLVELMLVEAMRQITVRDAPPGLLRGLGDERLAPALAVMHARVDHALTVGQLARVAALSRSAFHDRFTQKVGLAPMEYLQTWRMEIAKELLRGEGLPVSEVATRVGYGSTSTFTVAFTKRVGQTPARYARRSRIPDDRRFIAVE